MEMITSRSNDKIKFAVKLMNEVSFRAEKKMFFMEGARLCRDAFDSGVQVESLFVTEWALRRYASYVEPMLNSKYVFEITDEVAAKLSETKNPQGVYCVCKKLDKSANISKINYYGKYVALDDVANPMNFGSIARTAEAVGLDGLICGGGCDIYNSKALRASMGSLLRLPTFQVPILSDCLLKLRGEGMKVYVSVPDSSALPVTEADRDGGLVMVIGNEGNGVSDDVKEQASSLVTIPMKGRAESLNASAAASILMWEMMR